MSNKQNAIVIENGTSKSATAAWMARIALLSARLESERSFKEKDTITVQNMVNAVAAAIDNIAPK